MKIGVFTVCMPEYYPEEALEIAASLGYEGVEWRVIDDKGDFEHPSFWNGNRTSMTPDVLLERAESLRKKADSLNMEMPSLGAYTNCFDLDAAEAVFRAANAVGAKAARINASTYLPEVSYREQIAQNREQFGKLEKLSRRYGVKALMETHMGLVCPSVCSAMQVLDGLDPEYVGIMWDPGNQVEEGGERYNMAIRSAGPYLAEVHVKNRVYQPVLIENGGLVWQCNTVQLQYGQVNWRAVIDELKVNGYDGWLMMEDFSTVQAVYDRLKNNIDYLRNCCGVKEEK